MTRLLIAFLALLGLAAQAPACPRLVDARPEVGLIAAQRVAARASQPVAAGLGAPILVRTVKPEARPTALPAVPATALRAPVLPGIDRARE